MNSEVSLGEDAREGEEKEKRGKKERTEILVGNVSPSSFQFSLSSSSSFGDLETRRKKD